MPFRSEAIYPINTYKQKLRIGIMRHFVEDWAATFCGAITSLLTVFLIILCENLTGFNLFTLSVWVIVPVGALLCGFLAASGYYLGTLYFNHKASGKLLLNMVGIAGATYLLYYYVQYQTMVLEDGTKVSDAVGFTTFLDVLLTKAKYGFGRAGMAHNAVEVGSFGYVLGAIQFLGFAFGGFCVWAWLATIPYCEGCLKYFNSINKKEHSFANPEMFVPFHELLRKNQSSGGSYIEMINQPNSAKADKGVVRMTFNLFSCPGCKSQLVTEAVAVFNGKDWNNMNKLDCRVSLAPESRVDKNFQMKVS